MDSCCVCPAYPRWLGSSPSAHAPPAEACNRGTALGALRRAGALQRAQQLQRAARLCGLVPPRRHRPLCQLRRRGTKGAGARAPAAERRRWWAVAAAAPGFAGGGAALIASAPRRQLFACKGVVNIGTDRCDCSASPAWSLHTLAALFALTLRLAPVASVTLPRQPAVLLPKPVCSSAVLRCRSAAAEHSHCIHYRRTRMVHTNGCAPRHAVLATGPHSCPASP